MIYIVRGEQNCRYYLPEAPANGNVECGQSSRPTPPKNIPERKVKATPFDPFVSSKGKPKINWHMQLMTRCHKLL